MHVQNTDPDARNYRVSTQRLEAEGFRPQVAVGPGAEEIVEAIVSGRIADPEAIFYRNAKWLKELSAFGHGDHAQLLGMIEVMSRAKSNARD